MSFDVFLHILLSVYLIGCVVSFATLIYYIFNIFKFSEDWYMVIVFTLFSWFGFAWVAEDIEWINDFKKQKMS